MEPNRGIMLKRGGGYRGSIRERITQQTYLDHILNPEGRLCAHTQRKKPANLDKLIEIEWDILNDLKKMLQN